MDLKQQANQLKTNQLLTQILSEREHDIISSWRSATTVDEREQCATDLRALEAFRECLDSRINDLLSESR